MIHNMYDDECMQFYQEPLMMDDIMAMEPPMMDVTMSSSSQGTMSPSNSHNSGHNLLTPKGAAAILKPIRRRSRASKKTPTTLLKANTSNFRALVQHFTGNPTTAAMSLSIHKGPITLNFKQYSTHHHTKITKPMPPFGSTISSCNQLVPGPWQKQHAEQVPMIKNSNFVPTSGNSYSCMDDEFLFDNNDFSLHELTMNTISNDDHGLFM